MLQATVELGRYCEISDPTSGFALQWQSMDEYDMAFFKNGPNNPGPNLWAVHNLDQIHKIEMVDQFQEDVIMEMAMEHQGIVKVRF